MRIPISRKIATRTAAAVLVLGAPFGSQAIHTLQPSFTKACVVKAGEAGLKALKLEKGEIVTAGDTYITTTAAGDGTREFSVSGSHPWWKTDMLNGKPNPLRDGPQGHIDACTEGLQAVYSTSGQTLDPKKIRVFENGDAIELRVNP